MRHINLVFLFFLSLTQFLFSESQSPIRYLFPVPGSTMLPKETVIMVRYADLSPNKITNLATFIKITGEKSGSVRGKTVVSTDEKTIIFKPGMSFSPGEAVTVQLIPEKINQTITVPDTLFQFTVSHKTGHSLFEEEEFLPAINKPVPFFRKENIGDPIVLNGVSIPSDFPRVYITINDNPDTGYIFLNTSWSQPHYNMILDNSGAPVWYKKFSNNHQDFKVQSDGRVTMMIDHDFTHREFIAMDSTYTVVDTFYAPPGYYLDEHELKVLPNGHYLVIAKDDQPVNMSRIIHGGQPNAYVRGNSLAEMDANDNPVFIWRSWDHFDILDAVHEDLRGASIDYVHMNGIDVDVDGNFVISSRHLSEITKINRQTGQIMWRLGGENDYFEWINDGDRISYQHNIGVLPDGNYTVFDNGNFHWPNYSRALEFSVDTTNWTVTVEWEFRDTPEKYSGWMGNVQRLPNGNTLINWADWNLPKLTEVRQDGSKAFELNFVQTYPSYRTFRFPWKGKAMVPYLMIEPHPSHMTLIFNQFGDPDVVGYNIYGGTQWHPDQIIATSTDPFIHLSNELENGERHWFRITAVNAAGHESGFSNEENIFVQFIEPGENMVTNGDFSDGTNHWEWQVNYGNADWRINNQGELHFQIQDGSTESWHIQAFQPNIQLIQGKTYLFEFDARATQGRIIEAEVRKNGDPWTNHSKRGYSYITEAKTHFSHEFIMEEPTEPMARIVLNVGSSNADVFIDNVSLKEVVTSGIGEKQFFPKTCHLFNNYPNPFNPATMIRYGILEKSIVHITVFNVIGERIEDYRMEEDAGYHEYCFYGKDLPSGIYFYRMEVQSPQKGQLFMAIRKMLLVR